MIKYLVTKKHQIIFKWITIHISQTIVSGLVYIALHWLKVALLSFYH